MPPTKKNRWESLLNSPHTAVDFSSFTIFPWAPTSSAKQREEGDLLFFFLKHVWGQFFFLVYRQGVIIKWFAVIWVCIKSDSGSESSSLFLYSSQFSVNLERRVCWSITERGWCGTNVGHQILCCSFHRWKKEKKNCLIGSFDYCVEM